MEDSRIKKTLKGGVNIKISLKSVYIGIMLILLYNAVFVKFPYLYIQRIIAGILFMLILPKVRFRKRDIRIFALLGFYALFTLISAFLNKDGYIYTHTLIGGFFHVLIIFEMFQVFIYALKVKSADFVIDIFLFLSFACVLCNDFFVVFCPELFRHNYLLGNKFIVSYKHIELIVLYCMGKRKNIFVFSGIVALSLYISTKVNCMTGAVGIGMLAVFILMKAERLLQKRLLFSGIAVMSALFPFTYDFFTGIYSIRYFIVNILGRTAGMTGRTVIFDYLPLILKNHLILGYGYNTAYEVWTGATDWYPNAQNGFWNCVCEQGIVCAVLLVITAVYITGIRNDMKFCYPLMCVVYLYAILGAVEITVDITFIAWILFMYALKSGEKNYKRDNTRLQRGKIHIRVH